MMAVVGFDVPYCASERLSSAAATCDSGLDQRIVDLLRIWVWHRTWLRSTCACAAPGAKPAPNLSWLLGDAG